MPGRHDQRSQPFDPSLALCGGLKNHPVNHATNIEQNPRQLGQRSTLAGHVDQVAGPPDQFETTAGIDAQFIHQRHRFGEVFRPGLKTAGATA